MSNAESRAWNKLECLVRFRFPERIATIERLAHQAGVEVEWDRVELEGFAVVNHMRSTNV